MGAFKKFADFCAGIALFVASFYLFREFLFFAPADAPSLREKWQFFFEENTVRDYRPYLGLIGLLALSLLIGTVCRRLPTVSFAVATLPFLQVLSMLRDGCLYTHPLFYLILSALPIVGNLYDAVHRDSLDGRHRAFLLANVSSLLVLAFLGLLIWRTRVTADVVNMHELSRFDQNVFVAAEESALSVWKTYAAVYAVGIAVSLAFRGAYWLDALLALPPLVLALRRQILGTLGAHAELLLALMILCFLCRLALMAAGTGWRKKET